MRIKVKAKAYDIPQFEFGKKYFLAYVGCSLADVVVFTRKNRLEMCDIDGKTGRKRSSYWISKREFKQMIQSGCIHFIGEIK